MCFHCVAFHDTGEVAARGDVINLVFHFVLILTSVMTRRSTDIFYMYLNHKFMHGSLAHTYWADAKLDSTHTPHLDLAELLLPISSLVLRAYFTIFWVLGDLTIRFCYLSHL
jgi:hypothetical protein